MRLLPRIWLDDREKYRSEEEEEGKEKEAKADLTKETSINYQMILYSNTKYNTINSCIYLEISYTNTNACEYISRIPDQKMVYLKHDVY